MKVDLYLSSKEILRLLNDGYTIIVGKDKDGVIYVDTTSLTVYVPEYKKYLLVIDVDNYLDYDSDVDFIQDLKDECSTIKDYNIKVV